MSAFSYGAVLYRPHVSGGAHDTTPTLDSSTFSLDLGGSDSFGSLSTSSGTTTATFTSAVKVTYYVGVIGIDNCVQASGDTYGLSVSVSDGGIS